MKPGEYQLLYDIEKDVRYVHGVLSPPQQKLAIVKNAMQRIKMNLEKLREVKGE